jgi:hypothetical protein
MRKHRRTIVVAVVALVYLSGIAVDTASAGRLPYEADIEAVCNTTTGEYGVTATITSFLDTETTIEDGAYAFVSDGSGLITGETPFSPNPMPAGGASQTTVFGPGDSVFVEVGFFITEVDDSDTVSLELDGDCVAIPTTTTSSVAPTTSSAIAPGAAVAPRFAG